MSAQNRIFSQVGLSSAIDSNIIDEVTQVSQRNTLINMPASISNQGTRMTLTNPAAFDFVDNQHLNQNIEIFNSMPNGNKSSDSNNQETPPTLQNRQHVVHESGEDFMQSDEDQQLQRRMQLMMEQSAKDRNRSLGVWNQRQMREGNAVKMV